MSSFEFATQAKHTLVFTVIGGSIGGLTSAYWLKRAGHDVIVVEKYSEETLKDHKFSGLRSPPNLSRLLSLLPGMEKVLEDKASLNLGAVFHQADTSEPIGQVIWKEEMVADLGSKYYRIPYSDMWNHLYGLCIRENVRFKFNIEVQNITLSKSRLPTVIAVSGEQISCDIVIGADGHNSVTRNCILADVTGNDQGDEDSDRDTSSESSKFPELSEWSSCRLSIPIREMQKDPDLLPLTQNSLWYLWMGDGIFHTGGREGQDQYAVAVFYPFSNFGKKDGEWTMQETSSMTSGEIRETGCDLKVKKLLELASSCQRTTQTPYRLSQFTDSSNQIILIGDAAHGAVINGPQNTAIAVEDAFLLGFLFSKVDSHDKVPLLLNGFNQIKLKRTKMLINSDLDNLIGYTLPPGPDRDSRNAALERCSEDLSDDELAHILQNFINDFNYDMRAVAEEWWHMWGRLM